MEQTLSRMQRRTANRNELQTAYTRLNQFIESLNSKISNRIQLVQQVYIEDYKAQVAQMTQELKSIHSVLDEELLKQRANERLFFLEEERDFFREQVTKLNLELNNLTKTNTRLKSALEESKAEADNYKDLVLGLQRKINKAQNEAFETQKIKQLKAPSQVSAPILGPKETLSSFPTKPTLTRYEPTGEALGLSQRGSFRSVQLKRSGGKSVLDSQVKKKEQILEECIKDVKKKIFYRTLLQHSSSPNKIFFDEHRRIPFEKFPRTDKSQLISSVLSDPNLLEQFYNFMTAPKDASSSSTQIHISKSHRLGISDKIFKLKLSRVSQQLK